MGNTTLPVRPFTRYLLAAPGPSVQAQETDYFTDVTSTHVPSDADAHVLDIDFDDGPLDGFIGGWGTQVRLLFGRVPAPNVR